MLDAVAEDQRRIEGVLEGERVRVEENLKATAAARKARDKRDAKEDADGAGPRYVKQAPTVCRGALLPSIDSVLVTLPRIETIVHLSPLASMSMNCAAAPEAFPRNVIFEFFGFSWTYVGA